MPRPNPRRQSTALRLSDAVLEKIDDRALDEGLVKGDGGPNRSEFIRLCIEYALDNMPKGWEPGFDSDAIGAYRKYDGRYAERTEKAVRR